MLASVGVPGTFFVFGGFCLLCFAVATQLPELKGRSLEQVAELMERRFGGSGAATASITLHAVSAVSREAATPRVGYSC